MILKMRVLSGLLLLTLLSACSGAYKNTTVSLSYEDRQAEAQLIDKQVIQSENTLGIQLLQEFIKSDKTKNVIISPYSISTALSLAYNGASSDTATQMAKALGWGGTTLEKLNRANEQQRKLLEHSDEGVELSIANSIWYQEGIEIRPSFLNTGENSYKAEINAEDNLSSSRTLDNINDWVKKNTQDKITSILSEPLSIDTLSILINAIYFKGTWEHPFSEDFTEARPFTMGDGSIQNVQMMQQTHDFPYEETADWQAIHLPYGDGRMSMLIILPRKQSTIDTFVQQLAKDSSPLHKSFESKHVHISLPRFTADYAKTLNQALQTLGMSDAFDPRKADFSQMSTEPLYISEVLHKTFLEVNEKGTEAAAVTAVLVPAAGTPSPPIDMTIDRPFFFAIEDTQTKVWLFLGTITEP
ncbi:serpin family protein [Paenibacillus macquariensis]|uniref:Serpin B n=1 Tax=Paenibacillus macquariensis TaxID=948756 RepID=A0ABY1K8T9_9BACL|nr:serpin family protein [Paenibacillus macquariensis]MEC0093324.1 serpin family protein [Paenibacillus macquariensis]OAB27519.1 hypothetical protein PMSM_24925 [Paenibacillus macquariensis subsp. macquariensis]SIR41947.1 serpin B [Paenibacillus macquariensis]